MADLLREPLRAPAAWTSADIADANGWCFELSRSHRDEVRAALRVARGSGIPLLRLTAADFPLPTLRTRLRRVAQVLENGRGFAVLRGVPLDERGPVEQNTIFWGLAAHLGSPVSQDSFGRMLHRIDEGAPAGPPRTGGSDVEALLCPRAGAGATVVSSAALYNEVLRRDPALAERMYRVFHLDRHDEQPPGEPACHAVPLACWFGGRLSIRHARADIESAQRHPGVPRLAAADLELLDLIDELAAAPRYRFDIAAEAGDILLCNNYAVLHAAHGERLRLCLTVHNGRPLPPEFFWQTPGYGSRASRGGVSPRDVIAAPAQQPTI